MEVIDKPGVDELLTRISDLESRLDTAEASLSRTKDLEVWPINGDNFPMNKPINAWGIIIGVYRPGGDSYFIASSNDNRLFSGKATNGATTVTWVEK